MPVLFIGGTGNISTAVSKIEERHSWPVSAGPSSSFAANYHSASGLESFSIMARTVYAKRFCDKISKPQKGGARFAPFFCKSHLSAFLR